MFRLLLLAVALLIPGAARADDIAAAGRGVVRVVVVAIEDDEIVDFGHGSGFAVAPNRILTNAHVVQLAAQYPQMTAIGVVPSEGSRSYPARIVAIDPRRDLALLEMERGSVPPVPLYTGPLADGAAVAALGYPGNVDLATAGGMEDYITPLPPTRSVGIFSNVRQINGVTTLLHTAAIARGHSGGPLLDPCGRVLGVNTLITRQEAGDSPFFFAVANRELAAFLRESGQPFRTVSTECVSMSDRERQERERLAAELRAQAAEAEGRRRAESAEMQRALVRIEEARETRLGIAVLLLVLALVAFGGAGIMLVKDRPRPAAALAGMAALLLAGAAFAFFTRPSRADAAASSAPAAEEETPAGPALAASNVCRLDPERSRITVSATEEVALDWSQEGCVNARTQYAPTGEAWTRILVPGEEQTVTVAEILPRRGEYVVSRYLLGAEAMERARALRRAVELKACTADEEARIQLAEQQRQIREVLPDRPNERLVYRCEPAPAGAGPAGAGPAGADPEA